MIWFTYVVTKSDPTDPTIAQYRLHKMAQTNGLAPTSFNPHDYEYVCDICESLVRENTKHCSSCNRCGSEFDHHCNWVSNDIGDANYVDFMRMLLAVALVLVA